MNHKSLKINKENFLLVFVALYAILPEYFQIGGIQATKVLSLVFVGGWFFLSRGKMQKVKLPPFILVVLLIWIVTKSIVYFYNGEFSRAIIFWFWFAAVGYIIVGWINTKERFFKVLDLLLIVSAVVCVFGVIESVTHFNIFSLLNNSGASLSYNDLRFGLLRIKSFTHQTILYCMYCAIMACLALYRISISARKKEKRKFQIIYGLLCLNMLLTLSRSIIICFLASQIIMMYRMGLVKLLKRVALVVAFVGIAAALWSALFDTTNMVMQVVYMILAVFDGRFEDKLIMTDADTSGVGNRLELYAWVLASMKDHWLTGFGESSSFAYTFDVTDGVYTWQNTKESIEVNHLWLLYHYGIIVAITQSAVSISIAVKSFIASIKKRTSWEGKLNFNFTCFAIMVMSIVSWFAVNEPIMFTNMYLMWFLWMAYNVHKLYE